MPRVLCIYPWLSLGGADKFNLDMLACLVQRGWRATIATTLPSDHAWRAAFVPLCETIVDLSAYAPHEWPARLLVLASGCDVVLVSHSLAGYHVLPYLRAHLPHTAFVDYCHMLDLPWRGGGYPRVSVDARAMLDMQIVSSQQLKRWMCDQGSSADRVAVCTINIDSDDWDPARYDRVALRQELGIAPDAPVVLYAGRLTQQKQPRLAAEVMRRVVAQRGDVTFLVAGDGNYRRWLERFVQRHGLHERVRLLGAVAPARVRELLALSDLLFLPSENEGISLAIYEAMAMAVVPVGADVGGQRELVTPDCGVLVRRGTNECAEYVAALLRLLEQPMVRHRIAAAARQRVRVHFPLQAMGARMDSLLRTARERRSHDRQPLSASLALAAARQTIAQATDDLSTQDRRWRARVHPRRVWRALRRRIVRS